MESFERNTYMISEGLRIADELTEHYVAIGVRLTVPQRDIQTKIVALVIAEYQAEVDERCSRQQLDEAAQWAVEKYSAREAVAGYMQDCYAWPANA